MAITALAAGLGAVYPQGPVRAQDSAPAGVISLRSQTAWFTPDGSFTVGLAVQTSNPDGLEVAAAVYRGVRNRTEFLQSVGGRLPGRPYAEIAGVPLSELPFDSAGDRSLSFSPALAGEGVYPVRIELRPRGGGRAVDSFVTHLLIATRPVDGDPLAVAWLVPLHARPAVQPEGTVAIDDERAQELADLARSLDSHPDVGLTLVPTAETLEALEASPREQDRATLDTFVRALRVRQLLAAPFVPTNLTALLEGGLEGESAAQLTLATAALRRLFGVELPTGTRLVDERLSEAALAFLQAQKVDRLVVPEGLLEPVERNITLAETFELESRRGRVRAAMADAGFAAHFGTRNPVLAAHQLLADLSVVYFDRPGSPRGAVVSPGRSWQPSGVFTDRFLEGMTQSPILEGVTLDAFFNRVPDARADRPPAARGGGRAAPGATVANRTLLRHIAGAPPGTPPAGLPVASLRSARRRLEAFASALEPTNPLLDRIERTLLVSQSGDLRTRERARYLDGVRGQIDDQIRSIALPQNRSITLTSRRGEIPITITSGLGYAVRAALRVESDALDFPDGAEREVALIRRNTTEALLVETRGSGSFPLRVRLMSPDGGLELARSRFTVRSTAISGVGTALSFGAALFLLVWWGNHLRTRRSRRLVPA